MKTILQKTLLTIACLLCSIGVYAHDFEVDGIYYNYSSTPRKAYVTYRGKNYDSYSNEYTGAVIIPESVTYNGTTYSVTHIEERAFYKCKGLTSVTIPNSVTSIDNYAFNGCTGLKFLTIKDGDATLKMGYDYYSNSSKGEGLFYDCPIETLYIGRNLSYSTASNYGYSPFARINELKTVTIGNNVTEIGDRAFYDCSSLTEVTIPNSVTSIGSYAFSGCTGMTKIYCHSTTPPTIDSSTFSNYSATLFVPWQSVYAYMSAQYWENFTSINKYLVDGLYYTIISSTDVEVTYKDSYYNSYSGAINIPETIKIEGVTYSVTSIGSSVFYGCTGLTEITIPNSVTSIGNYAFEDCTGLKSLTIKDGDTTLKMEYNTYSSRAEGLFYDCPIETLYIGRNLSYITDYDYGYSPFYYIEEQNGE